MAEKSPTENGKKYNELSKKYEIALLKISEKGKLILANVM
jgi:Mor family transcriptional regulator